jgi:hypothetical protein
VAWIRASARDTPNHHIQNGSGVHPESNVSSICSTFASYYKQPKCETNDSYHNCKMLGTGALPPRLNYVTLKKSGYYYK